MANFLNLVFLGYHHNFAKIDRTRGLLGVPILWPFSIFNLQTASILRARSLVVGTHAMGCARTYAFGVGH
jgi:hypothetical protein